MGRTSRGKRTRRETGTADGESTRPARLVVGEARADVELGVELDDDGGHWVRIGVCTACGHQGQISRAEAMCVENMDACLRRATRKKERAAR